MKEKEEEEEKDKEEEPAYFPRAVDQSLAVSLPDEFPPHSP